MKFYTPKIEVMMDAKMQNLTPGEATLVDTLSQIIVGLVLEDEKKETPGVHPPGANQA